MARAGDLVLAGAGLANVMAVGQRERLLGPTLSHWDEAALYALLGFGLRLGHGAPTTAT